MTDQSDVALPGAASGTTLEGALLQAASDLTEAAAALRLDAERVWGRTAGEADQESQEDGRHAG